MSATFNVLQSSGGLDLRKTERLGRDPHLGDIDRRAGTVALLGVC